MLTPVITHGPTPPPAPAPGDEWYNPTTQKLYVWIENAQGGIWLARPVAPTPGTAWYNPATQRSYSWVVGPDGRGAWLARTTPAPVASSPPAGHVPVATSAPEVTNPTPKLTMAEYPPAGPGLGDLWWDTIRGFLFVFYDDGNTQQWVVANPGQGREEGPPGQTGAIGPPGIRWVGEWDVLVAYAEHDGVEHLGSSYCALADNIGMAPDLVPAFWSLLAAKGDQGEAGGAVTITEGTGIDVTGGPDYTVAIDPLATFPPSAHTHPQAAITNLVSDLALKAPLASPIFTGDPTAPTPATADNDTSIATTAYVKANIAALPAPPTTLPPSGTAGGDLSGTYPNPLIKPGTNTYVLTTTAGVAGWAAPTGGGGAATAVGVTPPVTPTDGQLWYYSDAVVAGGGQLMIRYNDGSSTAWVPASPAASSSAAVIAVGVTPPASPVDNQLWWNSNDALGGGQIFLRFNDGSSTAWVPASPPASSGSVVQTVSTQTGAVATGTGIIPYDNTIPQITEGDQYMTCAITPRSATSKLIITVTGFFANNAAGGGVTACALFQDSTANALAAGFFSAFLQANVGGVVTFTHTMTSGTTSATTFRVRAGCNTANTTTFNGTAGGQLYGGVMASSIVIQEVL